MTDLKQTAFHDVNLEHGAQMREMFGYLLPWVYAPGHVAEHTGTRTAASACDLDYMGEYAIEGPGALPFLQHVFTNDFRRQAVGSIKYTAMCSQDGQMVDDGTVWRLGDERWMFVSGDESDYGWLQANAAGFDVRLQNLTADWTTLAIQGPRSLECLRGLTTANLEDIRYYHFMEAEVAGIPCLVAAMGYTGETGFELHGSRGFAARLWNAVMEAGAAFGIVPLGQAGLESLRQEAGYLLVGNDHDRTTNPLEAGIGWTVRFGKEDFVGRDALLKVRDEGVKRRLVWFRLATDAVVSRGDVVLAGDRTIGQITSGSYSPTAGRGTAMGYVLPEFAIPGVSFSIENDGRSVEATVSVMPLYDPGDWLTKGHL